MAARETGTSRAPGIVIAAGGTGGHIYPGLALAEAIITARPDARITFVGTAKGLESELVPNAGHPLQLYDMAQFAGQRWRKVLVPVSLGRGSVQARSILKRTAADVAVSMGGYTGVPLVIGARLASVPAIVHEPGAVPGKANLLAARFTANIATAFPHTRFPSRTARFIGYPLRLEMTSFDRAARRPRARATLGLADETALVLVAGGSQGAMSLNLLTLALAERWAGRTDVRFLLKAGARTHDQIERQLASNPGRHLVELVRYINDMPDAYAAADLAIMRSGAGTVSELAVAELPSLLVPFPHDEHDEQLHNTEPLVAAGGAIVVRDEDATADIVAPLIEERLDDRAMLASMGKGMRDTARPNAAGDLAAWALELAA